MRLVRRDRDESAIAPQGDRARIDWIEADNRPHDLGASRAEKPPKADDLSDPKGEANPVQKAAGRKAGDHERRLAGRGRCDTQPIGLMNVSQHQLHNVGWSEIRSRA
jgi:hypothetical protein